MRPRAVLLLAAAVLLPLAAEGAAYRDRIGVAHVAGRYSLASQRDHLSEGAHRIRYELGSRVIKLWLARRPAAMYSLHSPEWPDVAHESDLRSVAAHAYFRRVFDMPFSTFILVIDAPETVWFGDGMSALEEETEEREMYALARHLIEAYAGSGKTFVLQNWEGDWLLRLGWSNGTVLFDQEPAPTAVEGMIRWLNARQRGVSRARAELAHLDGVTVQHAVEVNHVVRAKYEPSRISVTGDVLPFVQADLYSYSAWETAGDPTGALLAEMLAHLDERTHGSGNVYVGEYGAPENGVGTAAHLGGVAAQTRAALDWGARYVVYWQLYCNVFAGDTPASYPDFVLNSDMQGFWLIRPDGTRSPVWDFLQSLITRETRPERRGAR